MLKGKLYLGYFIQNTIKIRKSFKEKKKVTKHAAVPPVQMIFPTNHVKLTADNPLPLNRALGFTNILTQFYLSFTLMLEWAEINYINFVNMICI